MAAGPSRSRRPSSEPCKVAGTASDDAEPSTPQADAPRENKSASAEAVVRPAAKAAPPSDLPRVMLTETVPMSGQGQANVALAAQEARAAGIEAVACDDPRDMSAMSVIVVSIWPAVDEIDKLIDALRTRKTRRREIVVPAGHP